MKATLHIDNEFTIGEVDKRIFGSFIEHLAAPSTAVSHEPRSSRG